MTDEKTYYVTTPIYYVNGLPHVGSCLTTISCDVLARFHRLQGRKAFLLTGTDENATKVQEAAEKAGTNPQTFVNGLAEAFQACWQTMHIAYDDFIRTTEPRHTVVVQEFFRRLMERGFVYKDVYEGWYSVSDETFFRDSDVRDGFAIESGKPVTRVQEENYFFRLSAFGQRLLDHIEANPDFLQPDFRRNEVIGFIKEGLRDSCITRANHGWGIPFPDDDSKVIYVWFDALINYLSAIGWPDNPDWQSLWPADLHFMGKEIFVRFHATLWPAMLMALDLPLPKQVYAHGWWTLSWLPKGEKPGKSTGGLPHPTTFAQFLVERSGADFEIAVDAERYILCREMNFGLDTDFSVEACLRRFNTDLANDLGNLLNRTLGMMGKYYNGVVPEVVDQDAKIAALSLEVQDEMRRELGAFRLNAALEAAWRLVGRMNKYIDEKAPWSLAKAASGGDEASRNALAAVLYACLEATRIVSILVSPFMPVASRSILAQLGIEDTSDLHWDALGWGGLKPGTQTRPPQPIFPRIQDLSADRALLLVLDKALPSDAPSENPVTALTERIRQELQNQETASVSDTPSNNSASTPSTPPNSSASASPQSAPVTPTALEQPKIGTPVVVAPPSEDAPIAPITIDDFMKVQLKVGEVLAVDPVPNATKLLRLTVQLGEDDTRTILAGIAEHYEPDQLLGRQVVVVANLQPRKMRGIESQGMLLAADVDGRAILLKPDAEVSPGSRVR